MSKLTVGQKTERVLRFFLGLRNPRIATQLAQHGFTNEDLAEGWELLRKCTRTKLDASLAPITNPSLIRRLDEWENRWFPVAKATLQRHAPDVHDVVFLNLSQAEGPAVAVSVSTFLERIATIAKPKAEGGFGQPGKAAREILAKRGLTDEVVGDAKALLDEVGAVAPDQGKPIAEEENFEQAEAALWAWFKEWSQIARVAIHSRAHLRALGFLRMTASGHEVEEEDEPAEPAKPPVPVA